MVFELILYVLFVDHIILLWAIRSEESDVLCDLLDNAEKSTGSEIFRAEVNFLGN